ncbi:MAG: TPM domain-containing protein [Sandaracinaceae bacterium]
MRLTREDRAVLVAALGRAEEGNRGEVRLQLEGRCPGDALARAEELFGALGMNRTRDDTGVLLYVATRDRKTAVYAGKGVHGSADEGFWRGVADAVADGFRRDAPLEGLQAAIDRVGDLLRVAVPGPDEAGDELPNAVTVGEG